MENLTCREKEVLKDILVTLNIKDTAENLYISLATMKTHLRNIYLKLDVHNMAELVKYIYTLKINELKKQNLSLALYILGDKNGRFDN